LYQLEPQLREKIIKQREISDGDGLSQKFKYDLMISSSTADKNIVENIRQLLVNEGYNVWFDSNQNHGQGSNVNSEYSFIIEQLTFNNKRILISVI